MIQGVFLALSACFVWGAVFIIPQFMEGFSAIEIALGRHFFFGVVSLPILLRNRMRGKFHYPAAVWRRAFFFAMIITLVYYPFVIMAMRYASPALSAEILGISPIMIALYGNWKQRECSFKSLIIPTLFILGGLLIINLPKFGSTEASWDYIFGVLFAFLALLAWSWYAVANIRFLKHSPEVAPEHWATIVGVAALFWVIFSSLFLILYVADSEAIGKYSTVSPQLTSFLAGAVVLGVVCSWLGCVLWNRATVSLPISLAGQLTIFETIFGLLFVYTLDWQVPPAVELLGLAFLLSGVLYGLKKSLSKQRCQQA